ncbi:MAG: DUF4416 family protein [Desulfobacterales bacterium]|nr:DUF4416 family protein [Desulfobacterales bacterium]
MSVPKNSKPVKLVIGLFMQDKGLCGPLAASLEQEFGPIDTVSAWLPFDYTAYYEDEMGAPLFRRMLTFKSLIRPGGLPDIKLTTNGLEQSCLNSGKRRVNIDPGYLTLERFVLATGKNFTHRIYLAKGIYADLTLIYQKGGFQKLPWTYPDYEDRRMKAFLEKVRRKYVMDLTRTTGPEI